MGVNSQRKEFAPLRANSFHYELTPFWKGYVRTDLSKSRPHSVRDMSRGKGRGASREVNCKLHKLFHFVKTLEEHEGVPIQLKKYPKAL